MIASYSALGISLLLYYIVFSGHLYLLRLYSENTFLRAKVIGARIRKGIQDTDDKFKRLVYEVKLKTGDVVRITDSMPLSKRRINADNQDTQIILSLSRLRPNKVIFAPLGKLSFLIRPLPYLMAAPAFYFLGKAFKYDPPDYILTGLWCIFLGLSVYGIVAVPMRFMKASSVFAQKLAVRELEIENDFGQVEAFEDFHRIRALRVTIPKLIFASIALFALGSLFLMSQSEPGTYRHKDRVHVEGTVTAVPADWVGKYIQVSFKPIDNGVQRSFSYNEWRLSPYSIGDSVSVIYVPNSSLPPVIDKGAWTTAKGDSLRLIGLCMLYFSLLSIILLLVRTVKGIAGLFRTEKAL